MSFTYEDIQKTLIEKEVYADETYIVRALKTFGFDEFPKAGLTDYGANQLIKKVTDIQEYESNLVLKRERKALRKKKGIEEISIDKPKEKKLPLAIRIPQAGLEGIISLTALAGAGVLFLGVGNMCPGFFMPGLMLGTSENPTIKTAGMILTCAPLIGPAMMLPGFIYQGILKKYHIPNATHFFSEN